MVLQMSGQSDKTSLEIYTSPPDIWRAMFRDCCKAKKSIEYEQYILKDDKAGHKFLSLFTRKVKAGVSVKLMLDTIGCKDLLLSSAFAKFKEAGGIVYFYNPISLRNIFLPSKWLPRNHIKTMLIDGKVCYVGSVCIWDDTTDWHDLQARFTGGLVRDVKRHFATLWPDAKRFAIPPLKSDEEQRKTSYVISQFGFHPNGIYKKLLQGIRSAKKSIKIVTPYFLPPRSLRRALRKAVLRGVEVKIIASEKSDIPLADYVGRSYYLHLLYHGVRVFHYQKTIQHAKYVVIDDNWATIGSTNMDYLSLMQNREANIFTTDRETVAKIQGDFDQCLEDSTEVTVAYYYNMPWWQKFFGFAGRFIRRIL